MVEEREHDEELEECGLEELYPPLNCPQCGRPNTPDNPVTFERDPLAYEVYNDDTPVWKCEKCRQESADEI